MRYIIVIAVIALLGTLAFTVALHAVRYLSKEKAQKKWPPAEPPSAVQ